MLQQSCLILSISGLKHTVHVTESNKLVNMKHLSCETTGELVNLQMSLYRFIVFQYWKQDKLEIVDQWSTRIPRPIGEGGIVQNHKAAILKVT